jgi:NAD(P)-dependent dehydrogenase (short-subunit alcohol dehydrogenase family)
VLVTGGTSGLGAEVTRRFVADGAAVAFTGRDTDRGRALEAELADRGRCAHVPADARSPEEAAAAVAAAVERWGALDVLVANAGVGVVQPLLDTSPDDWRWTWETNVSGCLFAAQAAMRWMRETGRPGAVVTIASDAGLVGERAIGAYSVSKAAVVMMTRVLALDGAPHGIRVNCVCPGYFPPGMRHLPDRAGGTGYTDPPAPPLGRYGTAAEVADAVRYLAGEHASFVTGSVLAVEGGATAGIM